MEVARRRSAAAHEDEHVPGHAIRAGARHHGGALQFGAGDAALALRAVADVSVTRTPPNQASKQPTNQLTNQPTNQQTTRRGGAVTIVIFCFCINVA